MGQPQSEAVEFSRVITVDQLGERGRDMTVTATPAECVALAKRFDLVALDRLSADIKLRRIRGGTVVRLSATLSAEAVQSCVVSMEPVRESVEERFSLLYAPDHGTPVHEIVLSAEDEEEGELLPDGSIDVGEAVAQQLSLALDPYPRAQGIEVAQLVGKPAGRARADEEKSANPFGDLAALKERRD